MLLLKTFEILSLLFLVTRSMVEILRIIQPKNKIVLIQLDREPRRRRRRLYSATGAQLLAEPIPQRRQRRVKSLAAFLWCYCRTQDDGTKMVRCDKLKCPIKWIHVRCLPDNEKDLDFESIKWFCRNCRQNF